MEPEDIVSVYRSPSLDLVTSKVSVAHNFTAHVLESQRHIILVSRPTSSK
jgi:hypothetical protein